MVSTAQTHLLIFDAMLQAVSTKMLKDEAACVQLMWAREAGRRSCWYNTGCEGIKK